MAQMPLDFPVLFLQGAGLPIDAMSVLAFLAGANARAASEQRVVPNNWQRQREAWMLGYDHNRSKA